MVDLCLGTAQLGMQYGINNKLGKLDKEAAFGILDTAIARGIDVIDTASIYGEAEKIIGEYFLENGDKHNIKVISKQCNSVEGMGADVIERTMRAELRTSLLNLHRDYVDGYLLHSYREVNNREALRVLFKLKEEGLVKKIGASVYEIEEALSVIETGEIDYLQMPCSIFDQRGMTEGLFQRAKEKGITIFTRSAFLQGLLMMKAEEIPQFLRELVPYINRFKELLAKYRLDRKHAIIKFILSQPYIDYMVFGVESKEQLEDILSERNTENLPEDFVDEIEQEFSNIPSNLILPIHWRKD